MHLDKTSGKPSIWKRIQFTTAFCMFRMKLQTLFPYFRKHIFLREKPGKYLLNIFHLKILYFFKLTNLTCQIFDVTGADPELPPGGGTNPYKGRLPNILITFSEKPHEIKEILVCRGARRVCPPKSTTALNPGKLLLLRPGRIPYCLSDERIQWNYMQLFLSYAM